MLPFSVALGARCVSAASPQHADHPHRGSQYPSRRRCSRRLGRHRGADGRACASAWTLFQAVESVRAAQPKVSKSDRSSSWPRSEPSAKPNVARRTDTIGTVTSPISPRTRSPCSRKYIHEQGGADADPDSCRAPARPERRSSRAAWRPRPKVFLACLGRPADFNARASFAKSLFESGGIEAVEGNGDNLVKRFKEFGREARLPVLVDKVYRERGR